MNNLFSSTQQHFSFPIHSQENNLGVLAFDGADSSKFLQGQITADLTKLTDDNALTGAVCNLKGQVITNFYLVKANDSILMIMQHDLLDKTLQHLKRFAVFFKTTLSDVSDNYHLENQFFYPASDLVFTEQENKAVLRDQANYSIQISPFPIQHVLCISPQNEQKYEPLENNVSTDALSLLAAEPLITLANSEQFLPQMLNMQFTNGISFKKGCYTGQEIVARVQYRGKTKKRLYIGSINNTINEKTTAITNSDGKNVGDIVQQTKLNNTTLILAIINISDSESPLFISDEALTLHDLPYDLE
ncbi:YgfZ/GcvT domain-containing protein [Marinomonas sp. 2405UD68-3]|uniref:CAF17-like 4Fe-4S cluster assembly/insertion protein YgfZ n=1 Tax=Marinomonas sp. 2405UD68-3 TaxID=3391835 RepID=UPI0039C9F030